MPFLYICHVGDIGGKNFQYFGQYIDIFWKKV